MGFAGMFGRLLRPSERSRASITVEVFGWLIMLEGSLMLLTPSGVVAERHHGIAAGLRGADIHVCGIETRLDAFRAFIFSWNSHAFRTTGIETSLDAAA